MACPGAVWTTDVSANIRTPLTREGFKTKTLSTLQSPDFDILSYVLLHFVLRSLLWVGNKLCAANLVILQSLQTIRNTCQPVRQNFDFVGLKNNRHWSFRCSTEEAGSDIP